MKNSDYWKQRFEQLETAQNEMAEETLADIERIYRDAQKELTGEIAAWYARFAAGNGITLADARRMLTGYELDEFKWDVREYIRRGEENAITGQWAKQLENASCRYHISRLEALKVRVQNSMETLFAKQNRALSDSMRRVYESGYYRTAFELQKGVGIGWDIAALNQRAVEKVLVKPWAADGYNFSQRIWRNKDKLISTVHTELSRNIALGQDPQKAIDRITKAMETSRSNAGRLVMTEEAYFSSVAQGQAYEDLGVEQYEILATLDSHTSEICRGMDGKRFPSKDRQVGVTAPPFHVRCRSTTIPYDPDFENIGQRAARGGDGKTYYVPADMTYREWKKAFVEGGEKDDLLKIFQPVADYKRQDGSFDIEAAKEDYRKFLQSVPEKYRIYLEQSLDAVEYREDVNDKNLIFGYNRGKNQDKDEFLYNPTHSDFYRYDFRLVATHELGHRIDRFFVQSEDHADFKNAIQKVASVIDKKPEFFIQYCQDNDNDGFLSDIMSGLCKDKYEFPANHGKDYWEDPNKQMREIFTNLFALHVYEDKSKQNFLKEFFPDLLRCFSGLESML